jgi:outer membrane protein assembly factor BamB
VYVAVTGFDETFLHALEADSGASRYASPVDAGFNGLLNPVVHGGRVLVNAGDNVGEVNALEETSGASAWVARAGTPYYNSPAADDHFVFAHDGHVMSVLDAETGVLAKSIGAPPGGEAGASFFGTVMLGSPDHALAYGGEGTWGDAPSRPLVNFAIDAGVERWRSTRKYKGFPAVRDGVVYATSSAASSGTERGTLDALDERDGRLLWSWAPPRRDPYQHLIENVVVTDNVVFVSTMTWLYAIDLASHKMVWSAPTPGHISISADGLLLVSSRDGGDFGGEPGVLTAYSTH